MSNEVATVERRSLITKLADRNEMDPKMFMATVKKVCFQNPNAVSNEEFAALCMVAHQYGLNPILKEIYAFPAKGGGIVPIVGVDGWNRMMNDHPQMNGLEFEDHKDEDGKIIAITARIHRKDRDMPTAATEYLEECFRPTDPWKKWPTRMLRHKAMIQAARMAFGFSGIMEPDEAERMTDAVKAKPALRLTEDGSIEPKDEPAYNPEPEYTDADYVAVEDTPEEPTQEPQERETESEAIPDMPPIKDLSTATDTVLRKWAAAALLNIKLSDNPGVLWLDSSEILAAIENRLPDQHEKLVEAIEARGS